jgi:uncharacterized protein YciI
VVFRLIKTALKSGAYGQPWKLPCHFPPETLTWTMNVFDSLSKGVTDMFLAILRYKLPFEEVQKYVQEHRDYLDKHYQEKQLIVSGPMMSKTGGVILFRVGTREEVDRIIRHDPYYVHGVAEYEVIEFNPVKHDPVFHEHFLS